MSAHEAYVWYKLKDAERTCQSKPRVLIYKLPSHLAVHIFIHYHSTFSSYQSLRNMCFTSTNYCIPHPTATHQTNLQIAWDPATCISNVISGWRPDKHHTMVYWTNLHWEEEWVCGCVCAHVYMCACVYLMVVWCGQVWSRVGQGQGKRRLSHWRRPHHLPHCLPAEAAHIRLCPTIILTY